MHTLLSARPALRRKGLASRPKPHQMAIKLAGRIQYISPFLTRVTTAKCLAASSISLWEKPELRLPTSD